MLRNTDQVLIKVNLNFYNIAGVICDSGHRYYWWIAGGMVCGGHYLYDEGERDE
jgi:hypothetical protein